MYFINFNYHNNKIVPGDGFLSIKTCFSDKVVSVRRVLTMLLNKIKMDLNFV